MLDKDSLTIAKLLDEPSFAIFIKYLEDSKKLCDRPCEFYAEHPEMAHVDKGMKIAYQKILTYIDSNKKKIYAEADRRSSEEAS